MEKANERLECADSLELEILADCRTFERTTKAKLLAHVYSKMNKRGCLRGEPRDYLDLLTLPTERLMSLFQRERTFWSDKLNNVFKPNAHQAPRVEQALESQAA